MSKDIFAPIQNGDDVYELNEFYDMCKAGAFIDHEGYGRFSNGEEVSRSLNDLILPSQAKIDASFPDWATHVVWYNR